MGAEDPRSTPPSFSAMTVAVFGGAVAILVNVIAFFTTHWFVANTGAHAGLRTMVEKDWECGDTCPSIESPQEGNWKQAGEIMMLALVVASLSMILSIMIQCFNMTEYGNRKQALAACGLMDFAATVMVASVLGYWFMTKPDRDDTTPDSNGVVTTWTMGASYLGAGLGMVMSITAAVGSMVAKPEPEDEGMAAAVELSSPDVRYKMQSPGFAQKY